MKRAMRLPAIAATLLFCAAFGSVPEAVVVAQNQPVDWTGNGGDNVWVNPANWNGITTNNRIYIRSSVDPSVLLQGTAGSPVSDTITGLVLSNAAGTTNTLNVGPYATLIVQAPTNDYANWSFIGNPGTGRLIQTGGQIDFRTLFVIIGEGSGAGFIDQSGGTLSFSTGGISMGNGFGGSGRFDIRGNAVTTVNSAYFTVGMRSPSEVNVSDNASLTVNTSLNVGSSHVPSGGSGTFNQSGGTVTTNAGLFIGTRAGTSGVYNLSGSASVLNVNNTPLYIGGGTMAPADGGTGTFNQDSGTVNANAGIRLAPNDVPASSATYNLNGGTLNVTGTITDGQGTSTLNIDGGTLNLLSGSGSLAVDTLRIGHAAGRTGTFSLASGRTLTTASLVLGNQGTGTLTQSGGTANVGALAMGNQSGSSGRYTLDGGTLNVTGNITDGPGTSHLFINGGTLNWTGSTLAVDYLWVGVTSGHSGSLTLSGTKTLNVGNLEVGENGGSSGSVSIGPGVNMTVANWSRVGNGGPATFTQTGGDVRFNGGFAIGDGGGAGTYTISDGTLRAAQITIAMRSTSSLSVSGSALVETNTLYVGSRTNDNYGAIGTLTQTGGTVNANANGIILANNAGATGIYNLNDGILNATTIARGAGTGTFNFNGGTLHATTVNIPLTQNGGILAPGTSVGTTTINGDYTLNVGKLQIELASPTSYDVLNVNGAVNLAGGQLELLLGYAPQVGQGFTILVNDGSDPITGTFAGLPEGGFVSASFGGVPYSFQITYFGGTGNDVALVGVPEPSTLCLLAMALIGCGLCLRPRVAAAK